MGSYGLGLNQDKNKRMKMDKHDLVGWANGLSQGNG